MPCCIRRSALSKKWRVGMAAYGYVTNYAGLLCHMWGSRAVGPQVFESYRDYVRLCTEEMEDPSTVEFSPMMQVGTGQSDPGPDREEAKQA